MSRLVELKFRISNADYYVKTYLNTPLQIDRIVQDYEAVESTQGQLTRLPFRIPYTDNLIQAFGDLTDPTFSTNIDIRKNIKGSILIDGFPEYTGRFNIIGIYSGANIKELELIFKGDLSSLKARFVDVKLKDLLSGEAIGYNAAEIHIYFLNPAYYISTKGYAWPLIDYGHEFTADTTSTTGTIIGDSTQPLKQTHFKPAIQVKKILDLAAANQDIELSWDSELDNLIDNQFIPLHNAAEKIPTLDTSPNDFTGRMTNSASRASTMTFTNFTTGVTRSGQYDAKSLYNGSFDAFDLTADDFTAPFTGGYTFRASARHTLTAPAANTDLIGFYRYYINGVISNPIQFKQILSPLSATDYLWEGAFYLELQAGDVVTVNWEYKGLLTGGAYPFTYNIIIRDEVFIVEQTPTLTSGSSVAVGENIDKDLTAWDVVSTIIKQSNSILEVTDDDTFNIIPYNVWIENGSTFDINDKIEFNKDIKIEPTSVTGAKKITFTYEEGEDFYNKAYKDLEDEVYGTLKIDDTGSDFASKEVEVSVPFAATPPAPIQESPAYIPKFVNDNFEVVKTKPRIIYWTGQTFVQDIYFDDVFGSSLFSHSAIPCFGHWQTVDGGFSDTDTNFGQSLTFFASTGYPQNNLYVKYWEKYVTETYGINARAMTVPLKLTPADLITLNMNEKVIYNGGVWRFIKLSGINLAEDDLVMATLLFRDDIENIQIAPYYPYDVDELSIVQWNNSSDNSDVGDGSGEPAADIEESANAYGFYYDSVQNIALQRGKILIT